MSDHPNLIRILHVDDEPDFSELVATSLEREDERFEVVSASSAGEGRDRLAEREFHCIVSDHDMAGENGIAFLESVRADRPEFPFILFTGKGSEEVASEAISAGVTDYLQKGGGTDQYAVLANRIGNAVEKWRAERDADRTHRRLEAITENSNDVILTIDPDSTIRFANRAAESVLGYEPDGLVGESLTALMPPRFREAHLDAVNRYLETGERTLDWRAIEFPVQHRDGHEIQMSVSFSEFAEDGERRFVGVLRDISDRVRMEEALREREQRFRQLAENIQEIFWMTDPQKEELIYVNPAYERIWGRSTESLSEDPRSFLEAVHPADRDRAETAIDAQATGAYDETYRIIDPEGEVRWVHDRAVPIENDAGEIYRVVGIASDVTERRERESEYDRVLDLLDHTERIADVGGWEIDPATRDLFWSENLFDMLGRDENEEPSLEEALEVYVDADRPRVERAVESALEAGEPFTVEARVKQSDGKMRWLEIRGEPRLEDGEVVTLRGAVHDITGQRHREHVLREMYDIVSNPERSFDDKVGALLALGRRELDTEYGALSQIRGDEYVFEFVETDDDSVRAGDVVPVSATNCEVVASTEQTLVLGDVARDAPEQTDRAGYTDWGISCYIGAPVFGEEGVYGTFCFYGTAARSDQFSDWEETLVDLMSSWVTNEIQRRQANERLQVQNDQLQRFASIVSHDLRNPLTVAEGRLELAREDCDSEHLDAVDSAHDRMSALIEDLLSLAREGGQVSELESVDLAALADDCWANVATAGATLRTDVDRRIRADGSRVRQLLENLFRNAVEHGGDGVTITLGSLADGFYVEDDGPGIPEDEWESVFDAGHSTAEDGTGFGLSIVEQVAGAHGWDVRVTDGSAGGARFEITGVESASD